LGAGSGDAFDRMRLLVVTGEQVTGAARGQAGYCLGPATGNECLRAEAEDDGVARLRAVSSAVRDDRVVMDRARRRDPHRQAPFQQRLVMPAQHCQRVVAEHLVDVATGSEHIGIVSIKM
jgi:hypothetical protein